jgi:hypothetical protein
MKPLIIYRHTDGELKAIFTTMLRTSLDVDKLESAGWEVLGIINLKTAISIQTIQTNNRQETKVKE